MYYQGRTVVRRTLYHYIRKRLKLNPRACQLMLKVAALSLLTDAAGATTDTAAVAAVAAAAGHAGA